jgi:hypothetical protein
MGAAQHQRERKRVPENYSVDRQQDDSRRPSAGRGPAVLAWSVCALGIAGLVAGAILEETTGNTDPSESLLERAALLLGFGALPAIGALVASRHPRNAVGWLFLAVGAGIGVLLLSTEYAHWALVEQAGRYPLATLAAWLEQWLWVPSVGLVTTLILLLFPNGRPPSRRWNWLVWVSALALGIVAIGGMIEQRLESGYSIDNPIGLPGIEDVESERLFAPVFILFIPLTVLCATSVVVRFRRSRGAERQQLKLMTFSACLMVVSLLFGDALGIPGTLAVALVVLAASLAVSMLKYRLYDIDRIINKTVVYGALTAALVACYVVGVPFIQSVLPLPEDSPAAVAGSTLVIAALFGPLRRRVQMFVDRRFYRSRYDATKTVEAFESRVRLQSDLDGLAGDLVDVVRRTVHPSHVSLWLTRTEETTS